MAQEHAAERELALVGYHGRVLTELLQNAADACAAEQAAASAGQVLVQLVRDTLGSSEQPGDDSPSGWVLRVSNTGQPLTADGVFGLSALRLSPKGESSASAETCHTVGRFGVGFSAVAAVSDSPQVLSRDGGVAFTRAAAREAGGIGPAEPVPLLRWPVAATAPAAPGYATTVHLPVRADALDSVAEQLAAVGDVTLLMFPAVATLRVESDHPLAGGSRVISDITDRWLVFRRNISLPAPCSDSLTGDSGTAERLDYGDARRRSVAEVSVNIPRNISEAKPLVTNMLTPTPTDVGFCWGAVVLTMGVDVDEARRRVVDSPATAAVIAGVADLVADTAEQWAADGGSVWDLLPSSPPGSVVDGRVRRAVADTLRSRPVLLGVPGVADTETAANQVDSWLDDDIASNAVAVSQGVFRRVPPRDARYVLDDSVSGELLGWIAANVPHVVHTPDGLRRWWVDAMGLTSIDLAAVLAEIPWPGLGQRSRWQQLITAVADNLHVPAVRSAVGSLQLPTAAGSALPARAIAVADDCPTLAQLALQHMAVPMLHPTVSDYPAVQPVLQASGVRRVTLSQVPALPEFGKWAATCADQATDAEFWDDSPPTDGFTDDPELAGLPQWLVCCRVLLAAVAAGGTVPDDAAQIVWPDGDDEPTPAELLVQPGSQLAAWHDDEAVGVLQSELFDCADPAVWTSLGIVGELRAAPLASMDCHDVADAVPGDGMADWAGQLDGGYIRHGFSIVGLDALAAEHYPAALQHIWEEPSLRQALLEPVVTDSGATCESWPLWWLRGELDLTGCGVAEAARWLPEVPSDVTDLPPTLLTALGAASSVSHMTPAQWQRVLNHQAGQTPSVAETAVLWAGLSAALADGVDLDCPEQVWVLDHHSGVARCAADEVIVPDSPMWAHRGDIGPMVPLPHTAVADQADAAAAVCAWAQGRWASDADCGDVTSAGQFNRFPDELFEVFPDAPTGWWGHHELLVDGVSVPWWVSAAEPGDHDDVHASSVQHAAVGVAWLVGGWAHRAAAVAAVSGTAAWVTWNLG